MCSTGTHMITIAIKARLVMANRGEEQSENKSLNISRSRKIIFGLDSVQIKAGSRSPYTLNLVNL